jgi:hypothetical protein
MGWFGGFIRLVLVWRASGSTGKGGGDSSVRNASGRGGGDSSVRNASASGPSASGREVPTTAEEAKAANGWFLADLNESCTAGCASQGLLCFEQNLNDFNKEVSTEDGMVRKGGVECEETFTGFERGTSEWDVPCFYEGGCWLSDSSRALGSFDCNHSATDRQRLCYCSNGLLSKAPTPAPTSTPDLYCPLGSYSSMGNDTSTTRTRTGERGKVDTRTDLPPDDPPPSMGCTECPAGKFSNVTANVRQCPACECGRFSSAGSAACDGECPDGTYTLDGAGCTACPQGSACTGGIRTACISGTYQQARGQSTCNDCAAGKYGSSWSVASSDHCRSCPDGKYQKDSARSYCENVKQGFALVVTERQTSGLSNTTEYVYEQQECNSNGGTCNNTSAARDGTIKSGQGTPPSSYEDAQRRSTSYCTRNAQTLPANAQTSPVSAGVICVSGSLQYLGGVWHEPSIAIPSTETNMYTCVNNGCPDAGAAKMECKEGYLGSLESNYRRSIQPLISTACTIIYTWNQQTCT